MTSEAKKIERMVKKLVKEWEHGALSSFREACFYKLRDMRLEVAKYISHAIETDYRPLCFCRKIKYLPNKTVHVSLVQCQRAKIVYCIYEKNGTLQLRKHVKGSCPDGDYKKE